MRGTISIYQKQTQTGLIRGDNRIDYTFDRSIWLSRLEPRVGLVVDFEIENNFAKNILAAPHVSAPKNRIVAIALTILLGGIGIHKFYLGQKAQGWLYLLFFWTLIPSILSLFDLLGLVFTSNDAFDRRYN